MGLADKTFLVICDQQPFSDSVDETLRPIVKNVVFTRSDIEAKQKFDLQKFDGVIVRMTTPVLEDPLKIFQYSKAHKTLKTLPWVVLGTDIEKQDQVVKYKNLKFLAEPKDGAALIKLLEGLFFNSDSMNQTVDVNFINPFVTATLLTLDSMAQVKVVRGQPKIRKPDQAPHIKSDISGIIAMNSDQFMGSVAICFEEKLILKVFSSMMGTPTTAIDDDVKESVAEITNIIFGHAKRDLNVLGHTIAPAIPSVISGRGHEIRHSVDGVCISIPFSSEFGSLLIECVMRTSAPTA